MHINSRRGEPTVKGGPTRRSEYDGILIHRSKSLSVTSESRYQQPGMNKVVPPPKKAVLYCSVLEPRSCLLAHYFSTSLTHGVAGSCSVNAEVWAWGVSRARYVCTSSEGLRGNSTRPRQIP